MTKVLQKSDLNLRNFYVFSSQFGKKEGTVRKANFEKEL